MKYMLAIDLIVNFPISCVYIKFSYKHSKSNKKIHGQKKQVDNDKKEQTEGRIKNLQ